MSNQTAELLRKLLDERGAKYQTSYLHTSWRVGSNLYLSRDNQDGTLTVDNLTPEQAIAATLGSDREKALEELVLEMWHEITTCPDYVNSPCMTYSICERIRNLGIEMHK